MVTALHQKQKRPHGQPAWLLLDVMNEGFPGPV